MSSKDPQDEMTELDEAIQVARNDVKHANFFYDAFLNAQIFVPALRADKKEGQWTQIQTTDRFFPLYLRQGEVRAVPVFDRLEKLQKWAGPKAFDYLVLPTHIFLKVISSDVEMILNEGTPWRHYFSSEILEQLRTAMHPVMRS